MHFSTSSFFNITNSLFSLKTIQKTHDISNKFFIVYKIAFKLYKKNYENICLDGVQIKKM